MKIIINKKKLTPLIAIVLFILLGAFNISSGIAIHMQGDGATFELDKSDPVGYGVYIPAPNMYVTMSISGSNQGEFTIMEWDGWDADPKNQETVYYPGNDVSYAYPWYFEDILLDSTTNNDYIDPWSVRWLNVSAYNAENDTLSPYTLNTVFNYYVMAEESELIVPLNHSMPIQVDIMIDNTGPKILKFDWLTDDPAAVIDNYQLISPLGKEVMTDFQTAQTTIMVAIDVFDYIAFVANSIGTYRLLVYATHDEPAYLNLEFLDTHISTLPLEKLTFGGNSDENPTTQEMWDIEWQSNWFKINGKKGDLFRLDLGIDYTDVPPMIDAWLPCENRYILDPITPGVYDLYFPKSGAAYISFNDAQYGRWYRYSLFLSEIEVSDYNIGDNITSIRVSRDQRKAIDFTIEQDSFVRFNYTEWGDGDAKISCLGTDNVFIFKDAKKLDCYELLYPIETKTVDTMDFYYYYFPAGEYEAIIKNTHMEYDGVLQISSNFVEWANDTIQVNSLTYPEVDGSQYITLEFGPDDYYSSLKEAQWIGINITEPGQYRLNTTIWTTDNSGASATGGVSQLYTYNDTGVGSYHSFGYPQPAFSTDGDNTINDFLYIGSSTRWTGMLLNFSIPGVGGSMSPRVFTGTNWDFMSHSDDTSELTQNGIIEFSLTDPDFTDWVKGNEGFDIDPSIDENDYYWMRLDCTSDYSGGTVPIIELITLFNQTIRGDVNFALLRESGYQYCDTWGPSGIDQPSQPIGLRISRDEGIDGSGTLEYDSSESFIIESSSPYTIGFEEGLYKLLIVPEKWDFSGSIKIRFAVENYWPYKAHATYNISALTPYPNLHLFDINNYTATGYGHDNDTLYNYGLIKTYNHTEVSIGSFAGDQAYFLLEVYGKAYQWTQLVVAMQNVTNYDLYLLQDLPWINNNGPNSEVKKPIPAGWDDVAVNKTYEFGVHTDHFFLLFESHDIPSEEIMTFRIALSQYDTKALYSSEITATYTPPAPDLGPLLLTLLIAIPAAIGVVVVVVYVVRKKRIGVKHPT